MNSSIVPQKTCKSCGKIKSLGEFYKRIDTADGYYSACKTCRSLSAGHTPIPPKEQLPDNVRRCTRCGATKPLQAFRDRKPKSVLQCKECEAESARIRREANPIAAREVDRRYKEKHKDAIRQRRREDRVAIRDRSRARYIRDREKILEKTRQRDLNNPEQARIRVERRRARKRNLPNMFTVADWDRCLEYFDHKCAVCGRPRGLFHTLAMDHWIPLTDPRPDNPGTVPTNIVPLCHGEGGCNNSKHNHDLHEWLFFEYSPRLAKEIEARIDGYFSLLKGKES